MRLASARRVDNATIRAGRVLAVLCAGMPLVLLDVTVVNVALPGIARGLHTGVASLQWVVDAYAVTIASVLLAVGRSATGSTTAGCCRPDAPCSAEDPVLPPDLLGRRAVLSPSIVALTMNLVVNGTLFVSLLGIGAGRGRFWAVAGAPAAAGHFAGRLHCLALLGLCCSGQSRSSSP